MTNYGDTPDETPQNPYGQQPPQGPPGEPGYGPPPQGPPGYGQPPADPYGQPYGAGGGQPPYGQPPYGGTGGPGGPGGPAQFGVGDAFGWGWRKLQANLGSILLAAVVLFAAVAIIQIIQGVVTGGLSAGSSSTMEYNPETGEFEGGPASSGLLGASIMASMFFGVVSLVVQLAIQAGIVKGALDLTHGRPISLGSMFAGINWLQVLVASLIIAVATFIGFLLCILPGFAVMFLTSFTLHFIIDKGLPAVEAIKASVSFTIANAGTLIVFFLACLAAYIVGALLCLVGLLVAIPVVVLAQAYAYRTLQGEQVAA